MAFGAPTNGSHTLMHLLQTFIVEVLGCVRANLPAGAKVITRGRTMVKGGFPRATPSVSEDRWTEFVVQLAVRQFEDDMWPHLQVSLTVGVQEATFDVHPARTADEHARTIVDRMTALQEDR